MINNVAIVIRRVVAKMILHLGRRRMVSWWLPFLHQDRRRLRRKKQIRRCARADAGAGGGGIGGSGAAAHDATAHLVCSYLETRCAIPVPETKQENSSNRSNDIMTRVARESRR